MNNKQAAWAAQKALEYTMKKRKQLFMVLGALMLFVSVGMFTAGDCSAEESLGGASIATVMGVIGNVDAAPEMEKKGKAIKSKLWIISADQVDDSVTFPERSGRSIGTIPLKAGEYWHYVDVVEDTPEAKWKGEEGEIVSSTSNELSFVLGGMSDAVLNLLETGAGQKFYVVWQACGRTDKYLGGDGCKPLKLKSFEGGSTKDNTSTVLNFGNESMYLWSKYTGTIQTQSADEVAADATSITLTDNTAYQLDDGGSSSATIAAFSGVTDADVGRTVTILGSGGTYPSTIESSTSFILVDGETWTATEGAQITFQIYKSLAAGYTFIEVAKSRV